MKDPLLSPDLLEAGARYERASAPAVVTVEWLQEECARLERILRAQYDDDELPKEWERRLAMSKPANDTTRGLQLWAYLKHLYLVRSEGWRPGVQDGGQSEEAVRALLRREPVTVQVCGRPLAVTGRSYAAMMHIASHDLRGRELDEAIERASDLASRVAQAIDSTPARRWGRRRTLRRRLQAVTEAYVRIATERQKHRAMLYAHATTEHGGPAESIHDAPDWWQEAGPMDDAQLIAGLFLAGPGRLAQLPKPKKEPDDDDDDGFGYATLFSVFEKKAGVPTGRGWDLDLGMILADLRAGNAPYDRPEED